MLLESGLENWAMLCAHSDGGYRPLPGTEAGVTHDSALLATGRPGPSSYTGLSAIVHSQQQGKELCFPEAKLPPYT